MRHTGLPHKGVTCRRHCETSTCVFFSVSSSQQHDAMLRARTSLRWTNPACMEMFGNSFRQAAHYEEGILYYKVVFVVVSQNDAPRLSRGLRVEDLNVGDGRPPTALEAALAAGIADAMAKHGLQKGLAFHQKHGRVRSARASSECSFLQRSTSQVWTDPTVSWE